MSNTSSNGWDVAEIITALATTATAVLGWFTYKFISHGDDPVVECADPEWTSSSTIQLNITVRNRSVVAHRVSKLKLRQPRLGNISLIGSGRTIGPAKVIDVNWLNLSPVGSELPHSSSAAGRPLDQVLISVVFSRPVDWYSGKLRIDLIISDRSFRPRHRRFAILKFIQAPPNKTTADTIKQID